MQDRSPLSKAGGFDGRGRDVLHLRHHRHRLLLPHEQREVPQGTRLCQVSQVLFLKLVFETNTFQIGFKERMVRGIINKILK